MNYDELLFNRYFEDWTKLPGQKIISLLKVKTKVVLPSFESIDFSKKLKVKWGIDATAPDVHIGHLCPVLVLNIFVKTGHDVTLIIGDFTAKIGDPSGRVTERAIMTDEQIAGNFKTYSDQIGKYIDIPKIKVRKNSEWLSKLTASQLLAIMQQMSAAAALQRDDFRTRIEKGSGLSLAEICYGALVGYDSVMLNSDIELGGIDQLLNLQQSRDVQIIHGQKPEVIITNPILEGLDGTGRKMSKSYGNFIAVNASTEDKFGKLMSLPDSLLLQYYKCFGYLYEDELPALEKFINEQPMEAKKQLAAYFVSLETKSLNTGLAERKRFENKFSKKELSADDFLVIKVKSGTTLLDALFQSAKFASKGELKRLFAQNAIKNLDINETCTAESAVTKPVKIKAGKLHFFSIVI